MEVLGVSTQEEKERMEEIDQSESRVEVMRKMNTLGNKTKEIPLGCLGTNNLYKGAMSRVWNPEGLLPWKR
jgi:hypothetical protein